MERKRGLRIGSSRYISSQGQVTVFIIIGIILLFAFAAVLFIVKSGVTERLTAEGEPVIQQAPQEFAPLQTYTENCIQQIGKRGLLILGEQGGYIYPELAGEYSASDPTDADGLDLEPLKVPYWHYNQEPNAANKISFASLQPALFAADDPGMSIEAQLARFVEEKLDGCLQGYAPFVQQGFQVEAASSPDMNVRVGEETVNFWLTMEVDAARGEAEHTFDEFYVKIPLRLKHYYEVAQEIAKVEREYSFLERQALDLVATYGSLNSEKIPPTETVTFELVAPAYWPEIDVKEKVKRMLISDVPLLRYLGGTNFYRYEYQPTTNTVVDLRELHQKNYDNMIIPLQTSEDLEVAFDYFGWEPYIDLNDRGGTIEPTSVSVHYNLFHFNSHHYYTTYDISYPVLVTLRDPDAFDRAGFSFVFALEANVRNNELVEPEQVLPPPVAALSASMMCDQSKWNTEILRTVVVDSATREPLEAVQVGFSIPEQDDCVIGITNNRGELESRYPAVYGGVVTFIKTDYLTNFYPINTYNFREQPGIIGYAVANYPEPAIEMHPFRLINISVRRKDLQKCITSSFGRTQCYPSGLFMGGEPLFSYRPAALGSLHAWSFLNVPKALSSDENAMIILNLVRSASNEVLADEYSTTVAVRGNEKAPVELVPGVYEVTAMLVDERSYTIPEEERCVDPSIFTGEQCFPLKETILEKAITGQLQWDEERYYLMITPEELYGSEELVFYLPAANVRGVPEEEHVRVLEDLQVMGQLGNFSQILRSSLEPRFR